MTYKYIWTSRTHRRQGVASRLLDCVRYVLLVVCAFALTFTRANMFYGYLVPKELCAFSQPTSDGKMFFEHYRGTKEFLVYL